MTAQEVAVGVVVQTPDDIEVNVVQGGPIRRGIPRAAASTAPGTDALKQALQSSDFKIVAKVELVPMRPGTRALRPDHGTPAQIAVDVGVSESALVLVERGGWGLCLDLSASDVSVRPARPFADARVPTRGGEGG
jgi:hypothetical protein